LPFSLAIKTLFGTFLSGEQHSTYNEYMEPEEISLAQLFSSNRVKSLASLE
jgi:hypothetical protein